MQNQTAPRPHGVPESFYSKFGQYVTAVLSGFDRIRFRATLRPLFCPEGPAVYLKQAGFPLASMYASTVANGCLARGIELALDIDSGITVFSGSRIAQQRKSSSLNS